MADGRSNLDLKKTKDEGENAENKDWSLLLPELLTLVMSCLIVKDNIHASQVCKEWYRASAFIQMNNRHLWFMKHHVSSRTKRPCELYDPSQDITYTKEFPEIEGMATYHSKDGWLLMHKDSSSEMFFFNPFTRTLIRLPTCKYHSESAIFTCAPTSNSCLVFGLTNIDNNNIVAVNTLRLGETQWKSTCFVSPERLFAYYSKIIFSGGLFYCLGGLGSLAVFDPSKQTWNTYCLKYDESFSPSATTATWFGTYFIEIKGDIFLIKTLGKKPRVFRLNCDGGWIWEEKTKIEEGLTIFGASCTSQFRSDLANDMRNKLFLSDSYHPMITTYSFNEDKYLPGTSLKPSWDGKTTFESIWIEPPKQCLDFI